MKKIIWTVVVLAGLFLAGTATVRFTPYTALDNFKSHKISTRIYDANGELLQVLSLENGVRREFVSLDKIPEAVKDAFIQAEDKRFFKHHGIDLSAIIRALKSNAEEGRTVSGASTISMQLARIISPHPVRNIQAKIFESWNALRIESRLSKLEILELYLNNVPFGFNTEGVSSGARYFFGKNLTELNDDEIETLAKIPRRPQSYANLAGKYPYPFEMPHYVEWLKKQNDMGLYFHDEIHLPAVLAVQKRCEELLGKETLAYADNRLTNGAVLAIDIETGAVIAWAGSSSFYDNEHSGQIDGVLVPNQPGSSMKPFLYALALERGYKVNTVFPDIPMEFGFDSLYVPQNFNNRYNGPVRFRVALASSLNIPAVYLLNEIGLDEYKSRLYKLGFESLKTQDPGLSLALGGAEVTLLELVQAFSVFPRDGKFLPVTPMGTKLPEGNDSGFIEGCYRADTARLICSILSDENARALGFGYSKVFKTDFDSMFKTGTANQFQNITALGASGRYAVGVWMGNFSGETVVGKTGSSIPAQIVKDILVFLESDGREHKKFSEPEDYVRRKICSLSGNLAGPDCPTAVSEYIETYKLDSESQCDWHIGKDVSYPETYTTWFLLKNRLGNLSYSGEPLKIVSPRNGSLFYFDESAGMENHQNLIVDVNGGTSDTCILYLDGEYFDASLRPYRFRVPLTRGKHVLKVTEGFSGDEISISVR